MWLHIVHNLFSPYVTFGFHKIRGENKLKNIFDIVRPEKFQFLEKGKIVISVTKL